MPFPLIPVAVTAGLGGLAYLLFGKPATPSATPTSPTSPVIVTPTTPSSGGLLPPVKRPADLPPPTNVLPPVTPTNPIPVTPVAPPIPVSPVPIQPAPSIPIPFTPPPIVPIAPTPAPVTPSAQTATVTAPSGLNLRSGPNENTSKLYLMTQGTRVKMLSSTPSPATAAAPQGWYNVTAPNGQTGWASAQWLQPDAIAPGAPVSPFPGLSTSGQGTAIPAIPDLSSLSSGGAGAAANLASAAGSLSSLFHGEQDAMTAKVCGHPGVNLRSAPNYNGPIISSIYSGDVVRITDPKPLNGWYKVQDAAGHSGYMPAQYLQLSAPGGGMHGDYDFSADPSSPKLGVVRRRRYGIKG